MAGLRELAESDLSFIMEDTTGGFAWPFTLTNPAGTSAALAGLTNDISALIDPETGALVTGRSATVTLRTSSIPDGLGVPQGIPDASAKPWTVAFQDIALLDHLFKVSTARPDRALGITSLVLEVYAP